MACFGKVAADTTKILQANSKQFCHQFACFSGIKSFSTQHTSSGHATGAARRGSRPVNEAIELSNRHHKVITKGDSIKGKKRMRAPSRDWPPKQSRGLAGALQHQAAI